MCSAGWTGALVEQRLPADVIMAITCGWFERVAAAGACSVLCLIATQKHGGGKGGGGAEAVQGVPLPCWGAPIMAR